MSKHTPGPWEAAEEAYSRHGMSVVVRAASGRTVAHCPSFDPPSTKARHANARLIAAAPDLYAVCGALLEAVESGSANHMKLVVASARAALAKADQGDGRG